MIICYCCFWHPKIHEKENGLTDTCSDCGKSFRFPLDNFPSHIGAYKVVKSLSRGFYGATYLVEKGTKVKTLAVLKVIPKAIYDFYKKDFEKECQLHYELAQHCEHVIALEDYHDLVINFGNESLDCYVAQLSYVPGKTLKEVIEDETNSSARFVAQVAIDLYRLLSELEIRQRYHNDLHASNLLVQQLPDKYRRVDAIDDSIKVVAIDLGSIADRSSSDIGLRLGDIGCVAKHVSALADKLLLDPATSDQDFRLASLLKEHCCILASSNVNQRIPSYDELCRQIKSVIADRILKPWRAELSLSRLYDGYNAQTLSSWHVPSLVIDPNEEWLRRLISRGPTILTGIRGCGKTMILRSGDFHARACKGPREEASTEKLQRIIEDKYIGFYSSATRLLGSSDLPFEKLLIAFCRSVCGVYEHLLDLDPNAIDKSAREELSGFVAASFNIPAPQGDETFMHLNRWLFRLHQELERGASHLRLKVHPSAVFIQLAEIVRSSSKILEHHYILFLLDDVSTRYLTEEHVRTLVSELLFQSDVCSFKFTTEAQTLELVLHAPGQHSQAWRGRDYDVFDLGGQVSAIIKTKGTAGEDFLEKVLVTRSRYIAVTNLPSPEKVLGDCDLSKIAKNISNSGRASREKKSVYYGISALAGVCVGDIGDVISLYDEMIRRHNQRSWPIDPEIQSDCFQAFCSKKLFELSRRDTSLKDFALTFAKASHELLLQSHKAKRVRQYTKLYVSVTSGDKAFQIRKLRELLDAGVFALDGGTDTPRTKTRDSDPVTQFKLSYRKIFGLSSYIPLSDRDRFEISGGQLEKWLRNPAAGTNILLSGLIKKVEEIEEVEEANVNLNASTSSRSAVVQQELGINQPDEPLFLTKDKKSETENLRPLHFERIPVLSTPDEISFFNGVESICIGLGFEKRTLESIKYILKHSNPKTALCYRFPKVGHSSEILRIFRERNIKIVESKDENEFIRLFTSQKNRRILDISGLPTSINFQCIRQSILDSGEASLVYSSPKSEYPSDEDIQKVFDADEKRDTYSAIEAFRNIVSGDAGPYLLSNLFSGQNDPAKERALCAFSSAKHERLFTLLDEREFDRLSVALINDPSPRSRLAALAAEVAQKNYRNVDIENMTNETFEETVNWLLNRYQIYYIEDGLNFEIALTGSKIQTAAAAAVSCITRPGNVWYVRPSGFDSARFTKGYKGSRVYSIKIISNECD